MAYKTETIIEMVSKGQELPKQVTKDDLVRTIKSLLQQAPVVDMSMNVDNEKLHTVTCARTGCWNKASLPKSKAIAWRCENHR
jgi:hypothetical protein